MNHFLHWYYKSGLRGFYSLKRLLSSDKYLTIKNSYGVSMQLLPQSYIDSIVLKEGYYESEIIEALQDLIKVGDVIWDVGANFGLHSVTLKKLFPNNPVLAFEPLPGMQERIQENAELNSLQVVLMPIALSDSNGEVDFYTDFTESEGRSSLMPDTGQALGNVIRVMTKRAEDLINSKEVEFPVFMKMDIEGSEVKALKGFGKYLSDARLKGLIIEGPKDLLNEGQKQELFELLNQAGFQLEILSRNESSDHPLANFLARR